MTRVPPAFVRVCGAVVVTSGVFALWVTFGLGGDQVSLYFNDLSTLAAALAATVLCARAAVVTGARMRLFWSLVAGACGAWALGEALWAVYDLGGGEVPVPSWADAAYLSALPLIAAALLLHPARRGRAIGKTRSLVDGLVIAVSLFFLAWVVVLEPLHKTIEPTSLAGIVTLAYPLGDIVIVFLVVLVMRSTTTSDRRDLWCLLAGLLLITFADATYSYLTSVGTYATGDLIDTGWYAGYLALGLGAFATRPQVEDEPVVEGPATLTPAALLTPFVAMLAALAVATVKLQLGASLDGVTIAAAFGLVGLVLLRQALLILDLFSSRRADGGVGDRLMAAIAGGPTGGTGAP
jgi:hypothetical protein